MHRTFGPIFAALSKVFGGARPQNIARALARDLITDCKLIGPPFSPFDCARQLNLPIEYAAIEAEGVFAGSAVDNPKIILPRKCQPLSGSKRRRLNFTLAHEIGHYVIRRSLHGCVPASLLATESAEEEFLCGIFAAEFLMPSRLIVRDFKDIGLAPDGLCGLADRYDVSLQAILCRATDVWRDTLIMALWRRDKDSISLTWASPRKYKAKLLHELLLCDTGRSTIEQAFGTGSLFAGRDHFLLKGERMWWHTSSIRLPYSGIVLSVMRRDSKHARQRLPSPPCRNVAQGSKTKLPVQQFLPFSDSGASSEKCSFVYSDGP